MRAGAANKWVTLSHSPDESPEPDGQWDPLDPPAMWASIEPLPPGVTDGQRAISHLVRMRFHAGVGFDTRIVYEDARTNTSRMLFVRGFRDVREDGDEMQLICEEVR